MHRLSTKTIALALACLTIASIIVAQSFPISTSDADASSQASQPSAQAAQAQASASVSRNLTRYKSGGSFNLPDKISPSARKQAMTQIRAFLWQQWQTKQRGRVAYISTILHGYAPGTTNFYVEPDETGKWRIAFEVQGQSAPQYFYEVEQVAVDADGLPLDGQKPNESTTIGLHFKPSADTPSGLIF